MRRSEFEVMDLAEISDFLGEMSFGVLGTSSEQGWPELTPLNFVYHRGAIYFHGSRIGQKMTNLQSDPRVSFSVAKEFAIIPSYWSDPKLACPATAFFKSVLVKGYAEPVEDLQVKADAMTAFMEKLQPEGGYAPIDPADPDYTSWLKATSVVRIRIETITGKYKFGQNMKEDRLARIKEGLEKRNRPLDGEAAETMKALCPFHKQRE